MIGETMMRQESDEAASVIALQATRNRPALDRLVAQLAAREPAHIVTCARGSSDHAATYLKYLFETRLGLPVASFAPSVVSVYRARLKLGSALFVAISQSGRSPDLVETLAEARASGACTVAIVNDEDSPLAAGADHVLPISAGPERSVAATKSCLGAMAVAARLCASWSGDARLAGALDALPHALSIAREADWSPVVSRLRLTERMLLVSRGLGFAGVLEAALKLKETCMIQAEAFSAAEVRHGPMAIVGAGFPVLFASTFDPAQRSIDVIADLFASRDADIYWAGAARQDATVMPMAATVDPALQPIVFLQSFYRLANDLALLRGLDPDRPNSLEKVTKTI